jgi:hypothetical protein
VGDAITSVRANKAKNRSAAMVARRAAAFRIVYAGGAARVRRYRTAMFLAAATASIAGSAYTALSGLVASGRNGGTWEGPGIITSAGSGTGTTLGVGQIEGDAVVKFTCGAMPISTERSMSMTTARSTST